MKRHRVSLHNVGLHASPVGEALSNPAARVIDPVLTTAARGYRHPMHVHTELFPRVPSMARGGTRIEFDRTDFRRVNSRRAPGARTAQVQFGHEGAKFALSQHRLLGKAPLETSEEAMRVAMVDLPMRTVDGVQALISLEREIEAATKATSAATYDSDHVNTPAAAARWSADTSSPTEQVMEGVTTIRQAIGMRPNILLMGGSVYDKVRVHEDVSSRSATRATASRSRTRRTSRRCGTSSGSWSATPSGWTRTTTRATSGAGTWSSPTPPSAPSPATSRATATATSSRAPRSSRSPS